ncbi:MAG: desulfoferrodoxin family protein, partial [Oscillibacter sp.]
YICKHCGNVITRLTSSGATIHCCGEEMQLLVAGVVEAAVEKHIPIVKVDGASVQVAVGAVTHPMTAEHAIQWIALVTERDAQIHWLNPGEAPEALFALARGQKAKMVYAYCNLHGLWKAEV